MRTSNITVHRTDLRLSADDRRVIARFFPVGGDERTLSVIQRVGRMTQPEVAADLASVLQRFEKRHPDIRGIFAQHFANIAHWIDDPAHLSEDRRLLLGAYFTMEYAIESAALFNPSAVPHPDQTGLSEGEVRLLISLRATGEGHVSSIVFRTGVADAHGKVRLDDLTPHVAPMKVHGDRFYDKQLFFLKLIEMAAYNDQVGMILSELPDRFAYPQLDRLIGEMRQREGVGGAPFDEAADKMRWLARSNYELIIPHASDPADLVIFPTSENESRGIEDARLTRFVDDDGSVTYYGTYTAYNGHTILPQMFETTDFDTIRVHTLNGRYVQNKGLALFPRRVNGFYMMVSRLDGENLFLMKSDNPYFWNTAEKLQGPMYPWEFVQIGNCGPPIETPHGWLLLTHGVGPVRTYCIGAALLDLEHPQRVIGHLEFPLIAPNESERDGYVPNVVYSCGAVLHHDNLIIPYAVSDSATTLATVKMDELMDALLNSTKACPLPDRRITKRVG
ncbi:MAG: glycoside hydrolase family 130 protein [Phycisphaerales bacterium JB063]